MTGVTTGQTSLPTATDSDDNESYLTTSLVTALQALANLFESATGHDHTGAGKGKPIGSAGIASGIHLVGPVVDSGGLQVTAGNVGIGVAPTTNSGLDTFGLVLSGATTQASLLGRGTGNSSATTEITGVVALPVTAASAFTVATVAGFHANNPIKGAGSTITSAYGLLVDAITTGNTNNYGINILAPSGGSGENIGLKTTGKVALATDGSGISLSSGTAPPAAGVLMGSLPGFAAGSVYLIIDAGGVVRKSAIGPAS